ncbi:MAG TPA: nuclear transport factor 2 family protein [candidate division Zixibacteria bacterium]|nr:nuclear transport factor 2 family protein [candidate division Zixibacteria bacterium]
MPAQTNLETEREAIVATINASIGWAKEKDKDLLYNAMAQDEELFFFNPDDDGVMRGFTQFQKLVDGFFMTDAFKATNYEIRDLKLGLSQSGTVAWWACRLDDFCEINGRATGWEDIRWTGVMEKRDGRWQIVQQHFSYPTERFQK